MPGLSVKPHASAKTRRSSHFADCLFGAGASSSARSAFCTVGARQPSVAVSNGQFNSETVAEFLEFRFLNSLILTGL